MSNAESAAVVATTDPETDTGSEPGAADTDTDTDNAKAVPGRAPRWAVDSLRRAGTMANVLNEQFVGLGARADAFVRSAQTRLVRRLWPEANSPTAQAKARQKQADADLATYARVRLGELHLRVGQSLYHFDQEQGSEERALIRRQLLALLAEIERLEDILARGEGHAAVDPLAEELETVADIERLCTELEAEGRS
jgi:hypothetical protein